MKQQNILNDYDQDINLYTTKYILKCVCCNTILKNTRKILMCPICKNENIKEILRYEQK